MEAESEATLPQATDTWKLKGQGGVLPESLQGGTALLTPDCKHLASRMVRKQTSVVSSDSVCGSLEKRTQTLTLKYLWDI